MRVILITKDGLEIIINISGALPHFFYVPKFNPPPVVPYTDTLLLSTATECEFILSYIDGDTGYYYETN